MIDINANVEGRDLGSVSSEIQKKIDELENLPPGMRITLRGQSQEMNASFETLGLGMVLIIAVLMVFYAMLQRRAARWLR